MTFKISNLYEMRTYARTNAGADFISISTYFLHTNKYLEKLKLLTFWEISENFREIS